jgi:hypothetical protein
MIIGQGYSRISLPPAGPDGDIGEDPFLTEQPQAWTGRCRNRRLPLEAIATPNRVTAHPGEVLNEEFLKPLGMSAYALADGTDALRRNP